MQRFSELRFEACLLHNILMDLYMRTPMKKFWLILVAFVGLAATAVPASADLQYTLNCKVSPCSGAAANNNFGTVTLHQTASNKVTVTVQLVVGQDKFAGTGAGYAINWDLAGVTGANPIRSVTGISVATNPGNFAVKGFNFAAAGYKRYKASPFTGGSCGKDTASCFEYAIDYGPNGSTGNDTKLVFDVTTSSALALTDFIANPAGFRFAADISTVPGGCTGACTFVVASNGAGATVVPEPQTWLLVIAGLIGLPLLQRRRKPARAV